MPVVNAGGTSGFTGAATQAEVKVFDALSVDFDAPLMQGAHKMDAAAGGIHLRP
jgi:hypothetical protein